MVTPVECRECGNDLKDAPMFHADTRYVYDVQIDIKLTTIAQIKENLLKSPTLHADETGVRVEGRTQWIHVASNSKYTLVSVHNKRGKKGCESGGVLSEYTGTLIHNCWKPYFGFDKREHALCCAPFVARIERAH